METTIQAHTIEIDFKNEFGQHIFVITCPTFKETSAITYGDRCNCGHDIF